MNTDVELKTEGTESTPAREDSHPTTAQRPPLRLPPVKVIPREEMTFRQHQQAQVDQQAGIALEAEVRRCARELGLDNAEAHKLAESARAGFRIVNGEPIPVAGDRQTVLLAADGVNTLSVTEWVAKQCRAAKAEGRGSDGRFQSVGDDDEVLPQRNPFRRKTWNLTEQMRLQRRDPKLARRLKAEVWANPD